MSQEVGQTTNAWEEMSLRLTCPETVCPSEFNRLADAVMYLRGVLGEDFLERARTIQKHPIVGLMAISWPGLRSDFLEWIVHLRRVRQCQNVDKVIGDLRVANKCAHAYAMIEIAGRLRQRGFDLSFEPQSLGSEFSLRPDGLVASPVTGENFFLEVSCQSLAERQLNGFEAMDACQKPIQKHFEILKCSFSLRTIPAPDHMDEIVQRIEQAVETVLATGRLAEVIEEGTLEMGICHRGSPEELDTWRKTHGFHFDGYQGPRDDTNEIERLRQKIRQKQRQLPAGCANVLAIENDHIFTHQPNILRLMAALQEEVYKYENVASVLIRGSHGSSRVEVAEGIKNGEHRFRRHVKLGHVRQALLLSNRYAAVKPSVELQEALAEAFLGA